MGFSREPKEVSFGEHGTGITLEDLWIDDYEKWEPHVQAIHLIGRNEMVLRFCYWVKKPDGSRGDFIKGTMGIYDWVIDDFRNEIEENDAWLIKTLIKRLLEK